ncbi:phosphoribosylanthranilate isomerase [Pseudogemmatithrix spongiicola]|uniref:N-(5'-phosphoribosyl)anthranilate isomerase n=1 Tax=Pseudogemmatithrix spongiicola TaxID=3062599 RepID=A0AA49JUM9_9BACT|nr:phosphoribosylanthranilate isomerase [Gemmatimonadaceae bacterium 'strain 138']WKW15223.1 phosphoribosylanthranilate isomerase [Gemmatimonadaceae bacterium 'strain 318']
MAEVKFCGLTRSVDAAEAVRLGAAFAGVIFAGGPRLLDPTRASEVLSPTVGSGTRRVGVFGAQGVDEVLAIARAAALEVVQLSYGESREHRVGLRAAFDGRVWAVKHVSDVRDVEAAADWYGDGIDAIVLDAAVPGQLGGTGVALDWTAVAPAVARLRRRGRVVLAGGLRPENVATALRTVPADIVDVSSGVESAPGIKDPERMRAFAETVRAHEVQ